MYDQINIINLQLEKGLTNNWVNQESVFLTFSIPVSKSHI